MTICRKFWAMPEIAGEDAPDGDADRENMRSISAVGPAPQRHSDGGIEQDKSGAQVAELGIS